jgi:hypothetical protein
VADLVRRVPPDALYPRASVELLANTYQAWASRFGLRADVLWAQMLYETGGLRFGGDVQPYQHNLCGLRLPDGSGYYSFPNLQAGAIAHIAHLAVHALPDCPDEWRQWCLTDPKHPAAHWHDMAAVGDLERGERAWCPTPGYAAAVVKAWERWA